MAYNKETGMYEGYIYKIYNDINDKVYIGQTRRTVDVRWNEHVNRDQNSYIHNAILKHGSRHFNYKIIEKISDVIIENLYYKLDDREMYWIEYYDSYFNGYNCTFGGQNCRKLYSKTPLYCYDFSMNEYRYYDSFFDASNIESVDIQTISYHCQNPDKYMRTLNYKTFRFKDDLITNNDIDIYSEKYPKYYQYDFYGNLLNTFISLTEIADYLRLSYDQMSNVAYAANNDYKSAYGYIWRKYPNKFDTYKLPTKGYKKVEQYDLLTGKLINTYNSGAEASRITGCVECDINSCCNRINNVKQSGGFYWCYEYEFDYEYFKLVQKSTHQKYVKQYNRQGVLLNIYPSINEAGKAVDISPSKIGSCCNGNRKTAKNYIWRFCCDEYDTYDVNSIKNRLINIYTLNGEYLKSFTDINEIKNEFNMKDVTGIYKCCKHTMKTSYGLKWYYAEDESQPDKTKIIKAS